MQNEFEGKTVEDATAAGLKSLGLSENEAEIEVIEKGSRGIFGIGSSTAVVRILKRTATENSIGSVDAVSARPTKNTDSNSVQSSTEAHTITHAEMKSDVESITDDALTDDALTDDALTDDALTDDAPTDDAPTDGDLYEEDASSDELYDEEEISDDELADMAMDMLGRTVSLMGYDVEITARWKDPEPGDDERCLTLDVEGDNLGPLIGRRGETLDNLQYILRLMVNQKIHAWCNIVVDVASYKSRRAEQLAQMAHRIAEQVVESGRSESMEPMPSNERRIVHLTLRDHADVYTESIGDSDRRKVHVVPRSLTS